MPMAVDWLLTVATMTVKTAGGIVIEAIRLRWRRKLQVDKHTIPIVLQLVRLVLHL
tara:strand:- start:7619 stop:7786 length:168 start_codon:yes stop_codon:yes gene_type:complete